MSLRGVLQVLGEWDVVKSTARSNWYVLLVFIASGTTKYEN